MAKKSKIIKMQKQQALIERYAEERLKLKAARDYEGLAKLPRDSNPNRLKSRDLMADQEATCENSVCHESNFVN